MEINDREPRKKPYEDAHRRRKRLAAKHDIKTCGCLDRDDIGNKNLRAALYEFAEEQYDEYGYPKLSLDIFGSTIAGAASKLSPGRAEQESCELPDRIATTSSTSTTIQNIVSLLSLPLKRAFDVAFPSSYYDREACLNFYRDRSQPTEPDASHDGTKVEAAYQNDTEEVEVPQSDNIESVTHEIEEADVDDAMSDTGSDISIASTASITYNFNNSYQDLSYSDPGVIFAVAPHKLDPTDKTLLHPISADRGKRKQSPRAYQKQPFHPLHSFLLELEHAPDEAFHDETKGLLRRWLYETRPEFFTRAGHLQEYILHKGKPHGLSMTLWIWLCGRDYRLPFDGPDQLALKVAADAVRRHEDAWFDLPLQQLTAGYGLEFKRDRSLRMAEEGRDRSLWDKMLQAEQDARDNKSTKQKRSLDGTIRERALKKQTVHKMVDTELFQRATPEVKRQLLDNAIFGKLQMSLYGEKASIMTDILSSYSIEVLSAMYASVTMCIRCLWSANRHGRVRDNDRFWREMTFISMEVLNKAEAEKTEREDSPLKRRQPIPPRSPFYQGPPILSVTPPSIVLTPPEPTNSDLIGDMSQS
jgi:hypothetical protein